MHPLCYSMIDSTKLQGLNMGSILEISKKFSWKHFSRPIMLQKAVSEVDGLKMDLINVGGTDVENKDSWNAFEAFYKNAMPSDDDTKKFFETLRKLDHLHTTTNKEKACLAINKFLKMVRDAENGTFSIPPSSTPNKKQNAKYKQKKLEEIWSGYRDDWNSKPSWASIPCTISKRFEECKFKFSDKKITHVVHDCLWGRKSPYVTYRYRENHEKAGIEQSKFSKVSIELGQLRCLRDDTCLNDEVISAFYTVLLRNKGMLGKNTVLVNPQAFEANNFGNLAKNMKRTFHSPGRKGNLKMVVTINENKSHWVVYLLYVDILSSDGEKNEVVFLKKYCSMNNSFHCEKKVEEMMKQCFKALWKEWYREEKLPEEIHYCVEESLPKQTNGVDCGVFCCAVTTCLVDLLPNVEINGITQKFIDDMHFRSKICASILTGQLVLE